MKGEGCMEWNDALHEKTLKAFFTGDPPERLKVYPTKRKKLAHVLRVVITRFTHGTLYDEQAVNGILMGIHQDYVRLRRDLVDFGFLRRESDGSAYWRNETDL